MRRILIIIVNYRTPALAIDCLHSLERDVENVDAEVIVTDNSSGDDSVAQLNAAVKENGWESRVTIMPLEKNAGFSYGNNAPIRAALADARPPELILLLNPDTVIRKEAVGELAAFMDRNPNVGIAGSRLEDPDGTPQISSFRFPSVASELDEGLRLGIVTRLIGNRRVAAPLSENEVVTGWVAGASMMVRREVFEKIGLLDEGYFMYYEEVDFCLRALRAGWPCWYVPASRVVHLVGQSSGVTDPKQRGKRLPGYWFDSRRRFFQKHFPPLHARAADMARATGHLLNTARGLLQGRGSRDPKRFLSDFVFHSLGLSTKEKQ